MTKKNNTKIKSDFVAQKGAAQNQKVTKDFVTQRAPIPAKNKVTKRFLINFWLKATKIKQKKIVGDKHLKEIWQRKVLFFIHKLLMLKYISTQTSRKLLQLTDTVKKKTSLITKIGFVLKELLNRKALMGLDKKTKQYGILRICTGFTNLNFSLTTLDGKIRYWINGGCDPSQTRRTRMSSRGAGGLMKLFLKAIRFRQIRYLKILFTGPSKRYRRKFISQIKKRASRNKMGKKRRPIRVLCIEEGFRRSFNGCRLARKKR